MKPPADPHLIDQWLPQTQCRKCGLPSCYDYATSVSRGESQINRCPPGGDTTIRALANLTGKPKLPLDPECGLPRLPNKANIVEKWCIGCTLCIQACPVDAICGTAKHMHTVINAECTGCQLCLEPCPVDCIELMPCTEPPFGDPSPWAGYSVQAVERARQRTQARDRRLNHPTTGSNQPLTANRKHLHQQILESVERVRGRRYRMPADQTTR